MPKFTTILLPEDYGNVPLSGSCLTLTVTADTPKDAAAKTLPIGEPRRTVLVVDDLNFTHAFTALEVRRVEVTEV